MNTFKICCIVLSVLFLCVAFVGCGTENSESTETEYQSVNDSKQSSEYTWNESEALSESQQQAQSSGETNPWDEEGAKQPSEYTWEEFEALSGPQQIAFQNSFGSIEAFDAWLQQAQSSGETNPWDEEGAKQPSEYTWEEFEALSGPQQIAFQNSFEEFEDFDQWLTANQPE